jgi:hypothetical protein
MRRSTVPTKVKTPGTSRSGAAPGIRAPGARARQAAALLRSALETAPPELRRGSAAAARVEVFAEAERVAAAGKALYARRVKETAAYQAAGHRDAAGWLAAVSGDPVGRARGALDAAEQVVLTPALRTAFQAGELSAAQAAVVGEAAAVNPAAVGELLAVAKQGSFRAVKDLATRAKRVGRGEACEEARERRAHAGRYCRIWEPEAGGLRLDAWVTKVDGARILSRVERETDVVFEEARAAGEREPHERYRADALVRLVSGARRGAGANCDDAVGTHVVVRVDAEALRRGSVEANERCEIAGVGPVPVATARQLLGDCFFNVVVTDGIDVRCVTSTKRTIPRALRIALAERDPACVVPGCPVAHHLEIDHWRVDFARGGPTCLDNLARLCGRHHSMKTTLGWRLAGGPGKWRWLGPGP